jgi:hypothetical protein
MTAEVEVPIFELPLNELLEAAAVPMREEATNDINCEVRAFISQLFEREKASIPQIIFEIFFCGVIFFKEVTQQGGKIAILCANQIQTGICQV